MTDANNTPGTIALISPLGWDSRPYRNIIPFTYVGGRTHAETLEDLRRYVNKSIVEHMNAEVTELTTGFDSITQRMIDSVNDAILRVEKALQDESVDNLKLMTELIDTVNAKVAQIIDASIEVSDPVVEGLLNDPESATAKELTKRFAPAGIEATVADTLAEYRKTLTETLDDYRDEFDRQSLDNLINTAAGSVNLRTGDSFKRGVSVPSVALVSETSPFARDSNNDIRFQRGTTNLFPNPTMGGAAVGVVGNGGTGAFPTGWGAINVTGTIVYEVLSVSADRIRIKFSRTDQATGVGGIEFPLIPKPGLALAVPSRGMYVSAVNVSLESSTANVRAARLYTGHFTAAGAQIGTQRNTELNRGEAGRRITHFVPLAAGETMNMTVNVDMVGSQSAAFEGVIEIGQPQIENASRPDDFTDYTPTARASGVLNIAVEPGTYSVYLSGPAGGRWFTGLANVSGWNVPVGNGVLPVSRVHVFDGELTIGQRNAIAQALNPIVFEPIQTFKDTLYRFGGKQFRVIRPDTKHGLMVAKNRRNVFRMEVRPGERTAEDIARGSTNQRSEIYQDFTGHFGVREMPFDTNVYDSCAMLVEGDSLEGRDWRIFMQWHSTEDAGEIPLSPPFHYSLTNEGMLETVTRSSTVAVITGTNQIQTHTPVAIPYTPNKWMYLVRRVRFSKTGGGELQQWVNGVEVFNGPVPVGYNDAAGPYFQFGAYLPQSVTNRVAVQYANMEFGTDSLIGRVDFPLPVE